MISLHTHGYLTSSRSEVLSIYKRFATMVHTHMHIGVLRADFAGEYISNLLCGVLAEQATLAQFSCPGVDAHNGVAERKYHYLSSASLLG